MTASPRGEQNSRREILNLSKGSSFLSGHFMHASITRRAGALNASPTRHDEQTVIKSMFTTLAVSPSLIFARAFVGVVRD